MQTKSSHKWVKETISQNQKDRNKQYDLMVARSNLPIYMIIDRKTCLPRDRFHLIDMSDGKYRRYFIDFEEDHRMEWDLKWHHDDVVESLKSGRWRPVEPISHKDYLLRWQFPSPKVGLSSCNENA